MSRKTTVTLDPEHDIVVVLSQLRGALYITSYDTVADTLHHLQAALTAMREAAATAATRDGLAPPPEETR